MLRWRTSGELIEIGNVSTGGVRILHSSHSYGEWRGKPPRNLKADEVICGTTVNPVMTNEGVGDMVLIIVRHLTMARFQWADTWTSVSMAECHFGRNGG
ncbi:hypothetical protein Acr_18g0007860 [Actinidia rufa]|uniref:Uncharacterized protein n=1 Tax=Actinidia rufa TaxID=165716 RepID=A0A7J0G752_9ERIC|nr:hypothetical protein Acr_18g0007860 [Actinidia rufa]